MHRSPTGLLVTTSAALRQARGIPQGIENTNYFVDTARGAFVLTLIERIPLQDVPFYLRLMKHLAVRGIPCPEPVTDRDGQLWSLLNGKPATLVTRLPGAQVIHPSAADCATVGALLARMHLAARGLRPGAGQQPGAAVVAGGIRGARGRTAAPNRPA